MRLPADVLAIRARYVAQFPVPQTPGGGAAHEDRCRQWSIRFAEQVAFELPGQGWGMKRSAGPISKDTIARIVDGRLFVWDLLSGTGTGTPTLVPMPEGVDVTGQTFVPVTPTDHLGPTPEPPPVVTPPSPDLAAVLLVLAAQQHAIGELTARMIAIEMRPPVDFSALRARGTVSTGRAFGHAHNVTVDVPVIEGP